MTATTSNGQSNRMPGSYCTKRWRSCERCYELKDATARASIYEQHIVQLKQDSIGNCERRERQLAVANGTFTCTRANNGQRLALSYQQAVLHAKS